MAGERKRDTLEQILANAAEDRQRVRITPTTAWTVRPGTKIEARVTCPLCPFTVLCSGVIRPDGSGFDLPETSALHVHYRREHEAPPIHTRTDA